MGISSLGNVREIQPIVWLVAKRIVQRCFLSSGCRKEPLSLSIRKRDGEARLRKHMSFRNLDELRI